MANKKVLLINGHPDAKSYNFALAVAYKKGALQTDAEFQQINTRDLAFNPNLELGYRKRTELGPDLLEAQQKILWVDHLVCT